MFYDKYKLILLSEINISLTVNQNCEIHPHKYTVKKKKITLYLLE